LEYVAGIIEFTLKTRRAFIRILEDFGVKYIVGDELQGDEYFLLVCDGKRILAAEHIMKALKSNLIDIHQAYLLTLDAPKAMTGLSNAIARLFFNWSMLLMPFILFSETLFTNIMAFITLTWGGEEWNCSKLNTV
jgi:hypothetical protein